MQDKVRARTKRCFYVAVYLSRSGMQNTGLTSVAALGKELELRAFRLVSCILPRPLYFDPQERFRKLARELHDQRSRKKERQNESKRAAETVRRAASKTHVEIMLVLPACSSKLRIHQKYQKPKTCQPSLWIIFHKFELAPPDLILLEIS